MQKILPVLLIAALGLGAGFAYQYQQAGSLRQLVAQLQRESATAHEQAARAATELQRLKDQVASYKTATEQLETRNKELAANGPAKASPGAAPEAGGKKDESGGFGGMMKKMFTDPEMKKVMRSQQAMGIQMMYGDLAKELGLAPDDAKQVMELLADRQMAITGESMKLMGGEGTEGAELEETGKKIEASRGEYDKQLEAILGKDGLARLNDYERTIGERMQLQQYKQAFNAQGAPLDDQQASGLLAIMKEERLKQPPSPFDANNKDVAAAMKAMQSEEMVDRLLATQEDLAKRIQARAPTVLSPDQMTQLAEIQKQGIEMQKMGMKMGREMFKGKPAAAPKAVETESK